MAVYVSFLFLSLLSVAIQSQFKYPKSTVLQNYGCTDDYRFALEACEKEAAILLPEDICHFLSQSDDSAHEIPSICGRSTGINKTCNGIDDCGDNLDEDPAKCGDANNNMYTQHIGLYCSNEYCYSVKYDKVVAQTLTTNVRTKYSLFIAQDGGVVRDQYYSVRDINRQHHQILQEIQNITKSYGMNNIKLQQYLEDVNQPDYTKYLYYAENSDLNDMVWVNISSNNFNDKYTYNGGLINTDSILLFDSSITLNTSATQGGLSIRETPSINMTNIILNNTITSLGGIVSSTGIFSYYYDNNKTCSFLGSLNGGGFLFTLNNIPVSIFNLGYSKLGGIAYFPGIDDILIENYTFELTNIQQYYYNQHNQTGWYHYDFKNRTYCDLPNMHVGDKGGLISIFSSSVKIDLGELNYATAADDGTLINLEFNSVDHTCGVFTIHYGSYVLINGWKFYNKWWYGDITGGDGAKKHETGMYNSENSEMHDYNFDYDAIVNFATGFFALGLLLLGFIGGSKLSMKNTWFILILICVPTVQGVYCKENRRCGAYGNKETDLYQTRDQAYTCDNTCCLDDWHCQKCPTDSIVWEKSCGTTKFEL